MSCWLVDLASNCQTATQDPIFQLICCASARVFMGLFCEGQGQDALLQICTHIQGNHLMYIACITFGMSCMYIYAASGPPPACGKYDYCLHFRATAAETTFAVSLMSADVSRCTSARFPRLLCGVRNLLHSRKDPRACYDACPPVASSEAPWLESATVQTQWDFCISGARADDWD